jgi:two-component system phosphate regulon sensor histidine kinase PhoR
MADLQTRADEKQISLHNELPVELGVMGDADRLQQVFYNLIDNAIKYGRNQGAVHVTGHYNDGMAELRVQDNGPGIPPDSLDRVFERFYRVDRARSRDQGGTGLGLSIVKHIVHSHGGHVWAESVLGKGAIFHLTLPLAGLAKGA